MEVLSETLSEETCILSATLGPVTPHFVAPKTFSKQRSICSKFHCKNTSQSLAFLFRSQRKMAEYFAFFGYYFSRKVASDRPQRDRNCNRIAVSAVHSVNHHEVLPCWLHVCERTRQLVLAGSEYPQPEDSLNSGRAPTYCTKGH